MPQGLVLWGFRVLSQSQGIVAMPITPFPAKEIGMHRKLDSCERVGAVLEVVFGVAGVLMAAAVMVAVQVAVRSASSLLTIAAGLIGGDLGVAKSFGL